MKNRFYMLFVLIGLLCTTTATGAYAQHRVSRGGGGFGGGGRVSGSHYTPPVRVSPGYSRGGGYYHGYRGPVYHGGAYYSHGWYGPRYPRYYRYRPFYYPRIGLYVSTLPYGYFALGPQFGPVYYYGGTYYESDRSDNGYRVVDPPMNAAVPDLPDGATEVQFNGNSYYELNGTYYQEVMTDNGRRFKVVGKNGKIGNTVVSPQNNDNSNNNDTDNNSTETVPPDILNKLPEGSRSVQINGQQYYLSPDGMYYQQVTTNNGTGYQVVGKMEAGQ
ncbi:hypothetical protein HF324_21735 [Chitinophaga oryzae]|uniref:Uncharacterized protein n=1 Tax=Chitinophaga oryzae TaxID=2725414 RepID=A0AAE6ZM00_9BACT|nr:DUF6515 family protein [Chitinophaga oryzae]QJB33815.1 hypothetical protein HF329_21850 [Chitinophaga oryzae]QJB40338.1 hypothetical protein HF324_21735 [Chitinophaga oryzae]